MLSLFITCLVVFVILIVGELLVRNSKRNDELSRKFIHIIVGSFVAFWPLYLNWNQILLMAAAFLIVVLISKWLNIFKAIHSVGRPTWGEVFFAITIGVMAIFVHSDLIFAAAILHMSLADGLAAVMGVKFGGSNQYKILGHKKSLAGSISFIVVSLAILFTTLPITPLLTIAGITLGATILENISILGLDNLTVPLFVALVLNFI